MHDVAGRCRASHAGRRERRGPGGRFVMSPGPDLVGGTGGRYGQCAPGAGPGRARSRTWSACAAPGTSSTPTPGRRPRPAARPPAGVPCRQTSRSLLSTSTSPLSLAQARSAAPAAPPAHSSPAPGSPTVKRCADTRQCARAQIGRCSTSRERGFVPAAGLVSVAALGHRFKSAIPFPVVSRAASVCLSFLAMAAFCRSSRAFSLRSANSAARRPLASSRPDGSLPP